MSDTNRELTRTAINDPRQRCISHQKVVIKNQTQAEDAAKKINKKQPQGINGVLMHAYEGSCGWWHVGHNWKAIYKAGSRRTANASKR